MFSLVRRRSAAWLGLVATPLLFAAASPALAAGGFTGVGGMVFGRSSAATVTTTGGSVLVVSDSSVERYDPASRLFSFAGWLSVNRGSGLSATRLADGRVLIVGGQYGDVSQASAEIFDPATGASNPTGSMAVPRSFHLATLLDDGRVLVAGGHQFNFYNSALASAEIYDPATGTFSPTGSMTAARQDATATALGSGRVLVTGGYDTSGFALSSAEVYDAATDGFALTGSMLSGRANHTATTLGNGTILIVGGHTAFPGPSLSSAEIYDPVAGTFSATGDLSMPRGAHTATPLSDGRILVAGGFTAFPFTGQTLSSAEIYDPAAGGFTPTGGLREARGRHVAAALPGGDVVVAGGLGNYSPLSTAEVFSPSYVDTEPPVITVPADFTVAGYSPGGTYVYFYVWATDNSDASPPVSCQPASGTFFPVGTTTVACVATDSWGNSATASFRVTVVDPLAMTLTVDAFGSVDPRTGLAVVSGKVVCSRPASGWVNGELVQTIATRAQLRGSFYVYLPSCGPAPQPWVASVAAQNGRFNAGKAAVAASAYGYDAYSSAFASAQGTVQLRAKN